MQRKNIYRVKKVYLSINLFKENRRVWELMYKKISYYESTVVENTRKTAKKLGEVLKEQGYYDFELPTLHIKACPLEHFWYFETEEFQQ